MATVTSATPTSGTANVVTQTSDAPTTPPTKCQSGGRCPAARSRAIPRTSAPLASATASVATTATRLLIAAATQPESIRPPSCPFTYACSEIAAPESTVSASARAGVATSADARCADPRGSETAVLLNGARAARRRSRARPDRRPACAAPSP